MMPLPPPTLFDWPERAQIEAMERQRQQLRERINSLRPRSFRRVELQARLRDLTEQELKLQTRIAQETGK